MPSPFLWATEEFGGKGRNREYVGQATGQEAGKVGRQRSVGKTDWMGKRWKGRREPEGQQGNPRRDSLSEGSEPRVIFKASKTGCLELIFSEQGRALVPDREKPTAIQGSPAQ